MITSFQINLNNPRPHWHPGETVSGVLVLKVMAQLDVKSISISLKGEVKTKWRRSNGQGSTEYKGKVMLFDLSSVLFQGPFTIANANMSWPFEFVIPMDCTLSSGHKYPTDALFDSSDLQPLPPSFARGDKYKNCQIEYCVEGILNFGKPFDRGILRETSVPFLIAPARTLQITDYTRALLPRSFRFQTLRLNPEIAHRSLTFSERMQTIFSSESLPISSFSIKTEIPEAIEWDTPIKPILYLEHDLRRSTALGLPIVKLAAFSLALKLEVQIRTKGSSSRSSPYKTDWTDELLLGSWAGSIPLSERTDVSRLFRKGLILHSPTAPTFKTFNIAIAYRWKIKYTIECATQYEYSKVSKPCMVFGAKPIVPQIAAPLIAEMEAPLPPVNAEERPPLAAEMEAPPPQVDAEERPPAYSKQLNTATT